ncbi:molybdate ABC transporter substrate-binding protein [Aliiroseovarius sediminis]|uniref:molybdate ABC transporter substrate-binding protein n=1 Tax=Aliiroseovarius sediminis TaxID=2925839 RepID=UPI001F597B38|nr:molybdate ABC transporter substrate-binding protein [Aliiroseovarius sediminis]MCI2395170.1 molybdate ABC transporter substrate-binding protein [Aliiroseovarius sediminis]
MTKFFLLRPTAARIRHLPARYATAALAAITACGLSVQAAQADQITVFAAASLKDAMDVAARDFEAESGHDLTISYAGSSSLARQISQGAPADLFISANVTWMDVLQDDGQILPETRVDLLANTLVLIAPTDATPPTVNEVKDLAGYLNGRRLAMGLVNAVPAGIYGKAALEDLGQWDALAPLVAQADNVRAALALVALGEAPLGIVYGSDAQAEPKVQVAMTFDPAGHAPIRYPAAVIKGQNEAPATELLNWLQQDAAKQIFFDHGFSALDGS